MGGESGSNWGGRRDHCYPASGREAVYLWSVYCPQARQGRPPVLPPNANAKQKTANVFHITILESLNPDQICQYKFHRNERDLDIF